MKKTLSACAGAALVATGLASSAVAAPAPAGSGELAYYSNATRAPQSVSPAAMRAFLSREQPQFDLQSYPAYGSLIDDAGRTTTVSLLTQQTNDVLPAVPGLSYAVDGVMLNSGAGATVGGVQGVPDLTLPLTLTTRPWSIRGESMQIGSRPQFVDARVVSGRVGQKGAVYEYTAHVNAGPLSGGAARPMDLYVRATDTHGLTQWGYGPSGFFPQWIYPNQRKAIADRFDGSVAKYLAATNDSMAGQGSYYYTVPLLQVDDFVIAERGKVVSRGHDGYLLMDAVTQSFGPKGHDLVKDGVTWIEFSTQLPGSGQALKIGKVHQDRVGTYPYASLTTPTSPRLANGARSTTTWAIDDIHIVPVRASAWRSPHTGKTYFLTYRVTLDGPSPSRLTMRAVFPDQEVAFPGGRAVYEGLYEVSGVLNGERVSGQAWAEVQPAGTL